MSKFTPEQIKRMEANAPGIREASSLLLRTVWDSLKQIDPNSAIYENLESAGLELKTLLTKIDGGG